MAEVFGICRQLFCFVLFLVYSYSLSLPLSYTYINTMPYIQCNTSHRSCVDVAAELIKCIKDQFPSAPDWKLRQTVEDNLRVCFLKCQRGGSYYADGGTLGLHSKHFIIDDRCCYIGSQNLYVCDLAEWGVVIDSPEAVSDIKKQYWDGMWKVSYTHDDCNVDKVMDGLGIDRGAASKAEILRYDLEEAKKMCYHELPTYFQDDGDDTDDSDAEDALEHDTTVSRGLVIEEVKPAFDPNEPPPYYIEKYGKKIRNPEHEKFMKKKYGG